MFDGGNPAIVINLNDGVWLRRLRALKTKIKVGIIGTGAMGKGLCYQLHKTPGFECVALCDLRIERAAECAAWMGRKHRLVSNLAEMDQAVRDGSLAVCEDGSLLARGEAVDVVIEASNAPAAGGQFALAAIQNKKHIILMNAETDLIFGPYLARLARCNGVVYSSCDGDQPGVIKRLLDEAALWGFEIVMAGNIKGFLDRYANPASIVPEADKRNLDYRQATAYTDGTKLCVEMALIANACGGRVLTAGMRGPKARHVKDVLRLFDFHALHRQGQPFVDYILGAEPDGGVFVVAHYDQPYQKAMLTYYKMGEGPFYIFYRPYHLCHIEALRCVAEAVLDGQALLQPAHGLRTNVYAYAKRDLPLGARLDGIGGYTCYGLIENGSGNENPGLPIALTNDVTLKRAISKDVKINFHDVEYKAERPDFALYFKALMESEASESLR